ncbi:MAG: hypothetical protein ABJA94_05370 [Rhodoglobus sp.]
MRQLALDLSTDVVGEPIRAALFELGMGGGIATFACFADGTTSMYFSRGGGNLGLGGFEQVRTAADAYRAAIGDNVWAFEAVDIAVPPAAGFVQMVAVTSEGLKMLRMPFAIAQNPEFPGHILWVTGQELVTQVRLATQSPGTERSATTTDQPQ